MDLFEVEEKMKFAKPLCLKGAASITNPCLQERHWFSSRNTYMTKLKLDKEVGGGVLHE